MLVYVNFYGYLDLTKQMTGTSCPWVAPPPSPQCWGLTLMGKLNSARRAFFEGLSANIKFSDFHDYAPNAVA